MFKVFMLYLSCGYIWIFDLNLEYLQFFCKRFVFKDTTYLLNVTDIICCLSSNICNDRTSVWSTNIYKSL